MANFPTLIPVTRVYTPGEYPHTPFAGWSGKENRVRHSNVMLASQLRLSFVALTEAQLLEIISHYQGQLGSYLSFDLPSAAWAGVSSAADYELINYSWRYSEPPTVEDVPCDLYNVDLVLESVSKEGITLNGITAFIRVTFAPGIAAAANGINATITASLSAGKFTVPGAAVTVTVSLAPGGATGA
jgi:hypothetical protein